jgi:hypothetical protein
MNLIKKVIYSVDDAFLPREKKRQRERERIAREQAEDDLLKGIVLRDAALLDAFNAAKAGFVQQRKSIAEICQNLTPAEIAAALLRGVSPQAVGAEISSRAALRMELEIVFPELEKMVVGPAQKAFEDFRRVHKSTLAKAPKTRPAPEKAFVAAPPAAEFSDWVPAGPPSEGVRQMLGLKVGERVKPEAWEQQPDSGQIQINDLTDDND